MVCLPLPRQSIAPTPALNFPTAVFSSSWHRSFPTWCTTSTQQWLRIILLPFLHLNFLLLPPYKFCGPCLPMHPHLHLPKLSLVVFPLKLLPNPLVPLPFQSPSHLCHQHSPSAATDQLKSSKVSQQDILQINHLPPCQSSTASPPKTLPSLPLLPLLPSPSRLLPPLWSNRLSISSLETLLLPLYLPPTQWKDLNSLLLNLLQRSRPNRSGSQEALWLHSHQSSPHLLLTAP